MYQNIIDLYFPKGASIYYIYSKAFRKVDVSMSNNTDLC